MRTKLAIICAAVCLARAAFAVTMASQPWTTNRIAEAEARVAVKITAATNAIPAPDFSQNNTQLRETIVAVSPPADLTEATNHTRAALSAFASTGTVARAQTYGTENRWVDAAGLVWTYEERLPDSVQIQGVASFPYSGFNGNAHKWGISEENYVSYELDETRWTYYNANSGVWICVSPIATGANTVTLDSPFGGSSTTLIYSGYGWASNLVGRVALTNDIPATLPESDPTVPSWAKAVTKPSYSWNEITGKPQVVDETGAAAIAETVVREKSLGGIWDTQLEVWWTPVMRNGALTYQATTNVNLNAEN